MLGLPGLVGRARRTVFAVRVVRRARVHVRRALDRARIVIVRGQRRDGLGEVVIAARGHRRHASIGERQPQREEQGDELAERHDRAESTDP